MKKIVFLLLLIFICSFANAEDYTGSYELNKKSDISYHLYLNKESEETYSFSLQTGWLSGAGEYESIMVRGIEGVLEKNKAVYTYTDPDNSSCKVSVSLKGKEATIKESGCEDVNFSGKYKFTKKADTINQFMSKQTDGKWNSDF